MPMLAPRPPRPLRPLALLSLLVLLILCRRASAEPPDTSREVPFPTTRTAVLKDTDVIYIVDGRQSIPRGVEITGQKGIRIRGKNAAVLEVKGGFVVHGIKGTYVRIEGVRIELGESVQQLQLDRCVLLGTSVVTPEGKTTGGMITVENSSFHASTGVDIAITDGKVRVMNVLGHPRVRIRGVDAENATNRISAMVYLCQVSSLEIENVYDTVVRANLLSAAPLLLRGNPKLSFDSNRVTATPLVIEQPRMGAFADTTITKCDFAMDTLRIFSPAEEGRSDIVTLDKCWFVAGTKPEFIDKVIEDAADDPKNAVKVRLRNTADRPHDLYKQEEEE